MPKGTWLGKKHSCVVEHWWGSGNSLHESGSHLLISISRTQKTWGSEKIWLSSITKGSHSLELPVSPCKRISPYRWRCHLLVKMSTGFLLPADSHKLYPNFPMVWCTSSVTTGNNWTEMCAWFTYGPQARMAAVESMRQTYWTIVAHGHVT